MQKINLETHIYISSSTVPKAFKKNAAQNGFLVSNFSLISFEELNIQLKDSVFDWIFFSSIRSVAFFLKNFNGDINQYKIASIGETTTALLTEKNIVVNFTGKSSGKPQEVAQDFKKIVAQSKVLFPCSDRSNRSIAKCLPAHQILELVTYKTKLNPQVFTTIYDILVFTSPSNAESYLMHNTIYTGKQKIIAWGETTANFLKKENLAPAYTLEKSSYSTLAKYLGFKA